MKTIVQVVQQVRSTDTVTNTTSTVRYAYDDVHYFVNFEDIYEKAYA
ncbi:hypothetical protein GW750_05115 [bacterium]|nr:hypothetical protein [bacterium]